MQSQGVGGARLPLRVPGRNLRQVSLLGSAKPGTPRLVSLCLFTSSALGVCRHWAQISPFWKDTCHIGLGYTLMTSF